MSKNSLFAERDKAAPVASRDDFIEYYDKKLIVQPMVAKRFDEFVSITNWDESCGPAPLVFSGRAKGNSCFWSCRWSVKGGILEPDMMFSLDQLSTAQVISEAQDVCNRDAQAAAMYGLSPLLLAWLSQSAVDYSITLDDICKCLRSLRRGYPEFSSWWNPPSRVMGGICYDRQRPSWPAPTR